MPSDSRLPDSYDKLVPQDRLRHGEHNVRRATPSGRLKRSIEKDGLSDPLVVREVSESDQYHVTDGWQRYQAAVELGWDELPVNVYSDTLTALEAAERESIVREWTTYQAAQHVASLYDELIGEGETQSDAIETVADRTARTPETVKRYLNAFQIPADLEPLLKERHNITAAEWQALENYRENIRQFSGLSWKVAALAGKRREQIDDERLRRLLLASLDYTSADAKRLLNEAVADPTASIQLLQYRLFNGAATEQNWIRIPQTGVKMDEAKKQAVLDYCHTQKVHLSDVVERKMRQFAERVESGDRQLSEYEND